MMSAGPAHSSISTHEQDSPSWWRRNGPIVALLLLAPVISEVLYGGTRVSVILVLIPEVMTWGCAALLIRYWTRRWRKGWGSMLLLGLALAMAEECVIQQTSIAPLAGLARHAYGRSFGVNWVYLLWALGYESVWVVLVPVQLTELLFPSRQNDLWLRPRGMFIASAVFAAGSVAAWYSWTQRARVRVFHMQPYSPPPLYILAGLVVVLLLILWAYLLPGARSKVEEGLQHAAPSPWLAGVTACVLGAPWAAFVLAGYGSGSVSSIPFGWALTGGAGWAAVALFLARRWTAGRGRQGAHRYAFTFGAILACMLGGFEVFKIGGALRVDWIGKIVLNLIAAFAMIAVGRRLERRAALD